jgi:hypothetical protein
MSIVNSSQITLKPDSAIGGDSPGVNRFELENDHSLSTATAMSISEKLELMRKIGAEIEEELGITEDKLATLIKFKEFSLKSYPLEAEYWTERLEALGKAQPVETDEINDISRNLKASLEMIDYYSRKVHNDQSNLKQAEYAMSKENEPLIVSKSVALDIKTLRRRIENNTAQLEIQLGNYMHTYKGYLNKKIELWERALEEDSLVMISRQRVEKKKSFIGNLKSFTLKKKEVNSVGQSMKRTSVGAMGDLGNTESEKVQRRPSLFKRVSMTFSKPKPSRTDLSSNVGDHRSSISGMSSAGMSSPSEHLRTEETPENNNDLGKILSACKDFSAELGRAGLNSRSLDAFEEIIKLKERQKMLVGVLMSELEPEPLTTFEKKLWDEWKTTCVVKYNEYQSKVHAAERDPFVDPFELQETNSELCYISRLLPILDYRSLLSNSETNSQSRSRRVEALQKELINAKSDYEALELKNKELKSLLNSQNQIIEDVKRLTPSFDTKSKLNPHDFSKMKKILETKEEPVFDCEITYICVEAYTASKKGHITLKDGDSVMISMVYQVLR